MPFVLSAEDKVSRRFRELALLWRLRDGLRSGDVWVEGPRHCRSFVGDIASAR